MGDTWDGFTKWGTAAAAAASAVTNDAELRKVAFERAMAMYPRERLSAGVIALLTIGISIMSTILGAVGTAWMFTRAQASERAAAGLPHHADGISRLAGALLRLGELQHVEAVGLSEATAEARDAMSVLSVFLGEAEATQAAPTFPPIHFDKGERFPGVSSNRKMAKVLLDDAIEAAQAMDSENERFPKSTEEEKRRDLRARLDYLETYVRGKLPAH